MTDLNYAHELAERLDADLNRPMRRLSRGNKQKIGLSNVSGAIEPFRVVSVFTYLATIALERRDLYTWRAGADLTVVVHAVAGRTNGHQIPGLRGISPQRGFCYRFKHSSQ
jgi:hypothetical protein